MDKACKCKEFKVAMKRCEVFHKVQYGTGGVEYSWGYYTDLGERLWECPFCGTALWEEAKKEMEDRKAK